MFSRLLLARWRQDKHDDTFFLLNLSWFSVFLDTRLALKRTFSRWSDHIVIVNIYGPMPAGTWYGYIRVKEWANEMQDSRETAIDCLPLDAIRKLYQFDATLRQSMRITATIAILYSYSYDLLISKTEMHTEMYTWYQRRNLYEQNYIAQLFCLLPTWYLHLSAWIFFI